MTQQFPRFQPGKAAIFSGAGQPFRLVEGEVPPIGKGEILVRNRYTTICGSDVHTYCGHRKEPGEVVLGHEIVGEVLWFDPETSMEDYKGNPVQIGDRIVWSIFAVPAHTAPPRPDMPQKSDGLFKYGHAPAIHNDIFNGGLANYCVLRANTAFLKISADIPLKVAATISCAHATVAGGLRIAGEIKGKKVMIFGAGLLGLSCGAMCRQAGASWIGLVDNDNTRLQWGTKFGADEGYLFSNYPDQHTKPWPDADIVFDMTGNADAMNAGIGLLALGGCAVWIGAVFPSKPVQINAEQVVRKLLTIRGLHNYNYDDFVNAALFVENNYRKYPFEELVEKEFKLHEVETAFGFANREKPVRVGIEIS